MTNMKQLTNHRNKRATTSHAPSLFAVALAILLVAPPELFLGPAQAAPTPPTAPLNFALASGPGPGEIALSWAPPATDGGSAISQYRIYRGTSPGQEAFYKWFDTRMPTFSFVDRCVGHGQTWYYQISATNALGEGPRSAEVSAVSGIPPSSGDSVAILGGRLPDWRSGTSAVWTGQRAYIFGGNNIGADVLEYDPLTDCARAKQAPFDGQLEFTSAIWDGTHAYVFGGDDFTLGLPSDDIIRYDPALDVAQPVAQSLPSARVGTSAVRAGNQHLVFGGLEHGPAGWTWKREVFEALAGQTESQLPVPRAYTGAVWTGTRAIVLGGQESPAKPIAPEIFSYNPATMTVTQKNAVLTEGKLHVATAWDGTYAYVLGGWYGEGRSNKIQRYDPSADVVQVLAPRLPYAMDSASAMWDGRHIYLFGGVGNPGVNPGSIVIRFTPSLPGERDQPLNLQATRGPLAGQITLDWQSPANAAGLTGYRVYRGSGSALEIRHADLSSVLSFADSGLTAGANHCYKVTALYGATEGRVSNEVCAKAPELPTAPLSPMAVAGPNPGEIHLSWQAPADAGGIPLMGYHIYRNGAYLTNASASPFVDPGQAAWVQQAYTVSAINHVGEGPKTSAVSSYPASVPSVVRNLAAANEESGQVDLTWLAPLVDGGQAVTNYRVYRTDPGGTERWIDEIAPSSTFTDSYLSQGIHSYRVSAVNAFGEGPKASISKAIAIRPSEPDVDAAWTGAMGQVSVTWTIESDGGSPITRLEVYRGTNPGEWGMLVYSGDGQGEGFLDTVVPGINYYYIATVMNDVGWAISDERKVFIPPGDCTLASQGCPDPLSFCGITDTVDLDADGEPDCRDLDDDGDHLSDELEGRDHLNFDPRDNDTDNDGLKDHKDPVPTAKGFAAAIEVAEICKILNYDGPGSVGPGDPWLDSSAALYLNTNPPPLERLLNFLPLTENNHYHNDDCIDDYGKAPPAQVRDIIPTLPDLTSADWEWWPNGNVPNVEILFPLRDHDNPPNCSFFDAHDCGERLGENNPMMGTPNVFTVWSLMTMRVPGKVGIDAGVFDGTGPLTAEKEIWVGPNQDLKVRLRVNINASGCDLLTHILGKPLPGDDPHGQILGLVDFSNMEAQVDVGDVCQGV